MTSSPSRIVHTLHGPKTVDSSEPYPYGTPLPGAPIINPVRSSSPRSYSLDEPPPYVAVINRSNSGRRTSRLYSSAPYTRPPPTSHPTAPPSSAPPINGNFKPTWQDARRACIDRIQVELNTMSIINTNAMIVVERQRDRYRVAAENAQRELRRVSEERDSLREQFEKLSVKAPPTSPSSGDDFVQRFSSAGPLRRNSIPRSSRATSHLINESRCKSADPCLTSWGNDDCFDVTIVAPPLPAQRYSSRECPSPELIRDASRPGEGPRPYVPYSKPDEIKHDLLDILYIPLGGKGYCRACHINVQKNPEGGEVKTFPNNAAWEVFRDHYLTEHPSEHQDIVQLKSAQIFELRRRLKAKQSS